MRGQNLCLLVITLLAAGGFTLASGMQTGQDDLKKIQGTWKFTAQEMGGKPRPAEQLNNLTITFTDDKWTVRDGDQVVQAGTHKLDSSKNWPKSMRSSRKARTKATLCWAYMSSKGTR